MGRPPGKIQDRPFQMRVSEEFLEAIDKWRKQQPDQPSRAEAIRRLVLSALPSPAPAQGRRRVHIPTSEDAALPTPRIRRRPRIVRTD